MRKFAVLGASVLGVSLLGATLLMGLTGAVGNPTAVTATTTDEQDNDAAKLGFDNLGYGRVLSENGYWESGRSMN